jgi:5'-3' exonuclease
MSQTYILVDAANMFMRARHVVRGDDMATKIGMAYHIMFNSINKVWREQNGTHVVVCLEGHSWRKDFYTPYKRNRAKLLQAKTEREQDEDKEFWEAFNEFQDFMRDRTNCTVLRGPNVEADDFIARWVQNHPDHNHCIVSSDSDFYQLLSDNVTQFNGISGQLITNKGIFDQKGNMVKDKKTGKDKEIPDPEWLLFEKCVRGDTSDNIFSAYPGARKKGTKNKVGLLEAFKDRNTQGYNWNNFMLQRWVDHEDIEHRVMDDYQRNVKLIDLTQQPEEIVDELDTEIVAQVQADRKTNVGIHFMKFCGLHDLQRIVDGAQDHAKYLNASYN